VGCLSRATAADWPRSWARCHLAFRQPRWRHSTRRLACCGKRATLMPLVCITCPPPPPPPLFRLPLHVLNPPGPLALHILQHLPFPFPLARLHALPTSVIQALRRCDTIYALRLSALNLSSFWVMVVVVCLFGWFSFLAFGFLGLFEGDR